MNKIDDKILIFRENVRNGQVPIYIYYTVYIFPRDKKSEFLLFLESLSGMLEIGDTFETSSEKISAQINGFDFPSQGCK